MPEPKYLFLEDRGLIEAGGEDARSFLQGLISNDINKVDATRAVYAALLTAQGKFLHDFFIAGLGSTLLIDCESDRLADLMRRLTMYKLRAKATLAERGGDLAVAVVFGTNALAALELGDAPGAARAFHEGVAFTDPRHAGMGARVLLPRSGAERLLKAQGLEAGRREEYDRSRIALGLPDGSRDMTVEKAILLENGFDELHGVDWNKGCYVGQELTARTKHRGLIKKRLMPVAIDGAAPDPGAPVLFDGKDAGEMRTSVDGIGLALLRLEYLERARETGTPLTSGDATLTPTKPDWASF
ncbi:MAG: folate-binding protein [Rhodospirillales bacterium]